MKMHVRRMFGTCSAFDRPSQKTAQSFTDEELRIVFEIFFTYWSCVNIMWELQTLKFLC